MTTTTVPIRSSSRPGMITAVIGGSLVALVALVSVVSLGAGVGDRPPTATTPEVRHGSADSLERWLTPAAPRVHASPDALERRLSGIVIVERPDGSPDAVERRLATPAVDAQSPDFGSPDALERRQSH